MKQLTTISFLLLICNFAQSQCACADIGFSFVDSTGVDLITEMKASTGRKTVLNISRSRYKHLEPDSTKHFFYFATQGGLDSVQIKFVYDSKIMKLQLFNIPPDFPIHLQKINFRVGDYKLDVSAMLDFNSQNQKKEGFPPDGEIIYYTDPSAKPNENKVETFSFNLNR